MKIASRPTIALFALCVGICSSPSLVRAGDKTAEVETLRKALASNDNNARYKAIVGLQDLGPKAAAAAPIWLNYSLPRTKMCASMRPSPWARSAKRPCPN